MPKRQPMSGLILRGNTWHIKKHYKYFPGGRLQKSTGFCEEDLIKAEAYLAREMENARRVVEDGMRPQKLFKDAAAKYLRENVDKSTIDDIAIILRDLNPFIGDLPIDQVHDDSLSPYIKFCKNSGKKYKTINNALIVVRRILNLSARHWKHNLPNGKSLSWLETAPLITQLTVTDAALPYPLNWKEQEEFFENLPKHLADMALFKVNTVTREQEVCQLRWEWEVTIPELGTSIFIVPAYLLNDMEDGASEPEAMVKNRQDRLIVLNDVAKEIVESRRGIHDEYVFTYVRIFKDTVKAQAKRKTSAKGINRPVCNINTKAWRKAWKASGFPVSKRYCRGVHNLKHTYGRRLRAAKVPYETRQVLLGHKNKDTTTHYSSAEIQELIDASNSILESKENTPTLTLLKLNAKSGRGYKNGTNNEINDRCF